MASFKKERHQLEDAAAKLLSAASTAGAESAEVCATFSQKTKITLEKQDYHMASWDDGYWLGVRVIWKNRQGFASANSTDAKELKELAGRAVEIAKLSPENPYWTIPPSANIPKEAPASLWDESLHQVSIQTQKEWTRLMVDEVMRDPRFRLSDGAVSLSSGLYLVANSLGTHKLERETAAHWSVMGMGVEGEKITSFDHFSELSRKFDGIPERILASSRRFREVVLENLRQGPSSNYKGLVVFSPRAVIDILLSPLCYQLNGRNVAEGTTRWTAESFGQSIFSRELTLTDRPWLADRAGCAVFDREGIPTQDMALIDEGKLMGFFLDSYAAHALQSRSTGHAAGGPSAPPGVSPHNLVLSGGAKPWAELLGQALTARKEFLLVHRYSGQVDPVTGDFSGVAKGAEWWTSGERAHHTKETLISGNLFDVLGKGLFGITRETQIVDCAEEAPTLLADGVSVTGS